MATSPRSLRRGGLSSEELKPTHTCQADERRQEAKKFFDKILSGLKDALDKESSPAERKRINQGYLNLLEGFDGLLELLRDDEGLNAEYGFICMREIAAGAFVAGSLSRTGSFEDIPLDYISIQRGRARLNGLKSAQKKQAIAETKRAHARDLMKQILLETPNIKREALASEIEFRWKDGDSLGHAALVKFVRSELGLKSHIWLKEYLAGTAKS